MVVQNTHRWLSVRVRLACMLVFVLGSLLPPYVPKAALAPQEASVASPQFLLVEEGFLMKTSPLTQHGTRRAYAEGIVHIVKPGESLERLASRYDISIDTIRWANDLEEGSTINPDDELLILPVDGVLHTVSRGQTLMRVAELYGISAEEITDQNNLQGGFIAADQELIIPGGRPIVSKPVVVAAAPPGSTQVAVKPAEVTKVITQPPQGVGPVEPSAGVLQKPCSAACFYTQYYRVGHYAVDMQERGGGPVYAAEAGTVTRSETGWNGGYGNVIEIDHGNGLTTLYAHNKELYVREGAVVRRGDLISWMGNTGKVYGQTGIHLHFEVILNGVKKNPILYLE